MITSAKISRRIAYFEFRASSGRPTSNRLVTCVSNNIQAQVLVGNIGIATNIDQDIFGLGH